MSISTYERPITDEILDLMKTAFGNTFRNYFDGDPVYIGASNLPCLIVDKQKTSINETAPTGMVSLAHTIVVQVEFDKRPEFGGQASEVVLKKKLEQIAEGRDPITKSFGEKTIAGVLQRNFTLGDLSTGQTLEIAYDLIPRSQRGDLITEAVSVTGVFEELIPITRA